jgi:glycosyltransferase involved in cell wall biosynthesis
MSEQPTVVLPAVPAEVLPSIGVVLPTHNRPELMRRAIESVLAQDYSGPLRVVVVFDRAEPDMSLVRGGDRPVEVIANTRVPGLAGARNSGITALRTDLVAFCDDDDTWHPGKLRRQVQELAGASGAEMVTCAVEVDYDGQVSPRLAGQTRVGVGDLARSRMAMLHSSTFVLRRDALLGELGLVAEDAPGSQNEDWDLLLRASRRRPIVHVDEPLVRVLWGGTSLFASAYDTKIASLRWMLDRHPEIRASRVGAARVYGQLACWHAASGQRRAAVRWAGRAVRSHWREPRAVIAFAAAAGVVRVPTVLAALHKRGRGI